MSGEMRVLTVKQPWAWAIIHAEKDVENRSRNLAGSYRGPVAIHAGLGFDQGNMASHAHKRAHGTETPTYLAFGAIIGVVDLVAVHFWDECLEGVFGCSPWAESDAHHLVLANPRPLAHPLPFRGGLGLRRLDAATVDLIQKELP